MLIGGRDERAPRQFAVHSPDRYPRRARPLPGGRGRARASAAVDAASAALSALGGDAVAGARAQCCGARSSSIEARVYFIGAALALEVGKNRMEALGEAQETADLIAYYCDQMERNDGYDEGDAARPAAGLREREPQRAAGRTAYGS